MKINNRIVILFAFFLIGACTPKEKTAPTIPTVESLSFDFSYFEQSSTEGTHYAFAVEQVYKWKALLTDSINIHHTTLNESSYNDFIFQKDETWLMDFDFNIEDDNYTTNLFGIIETDTVLYKAFLTLNNTDTSLIYLDGKFFDNSKSGQWILNNPGFNEDTVYTGIKFMTIEWNLDSLNQKEIKFTDNKVGDSNNNSLLHKDSVDSQYLEYVDIYNKQDENHSIIQWNLLTGSGRIKNLKHFGNENWYCWDENYQDTDCKNITENKE